MADDQPTDGDRREPTWRQAVAQLAASGTLDATQARAVTAALEPVLDTGEPPPPASRLRRGVRGLLGELAGYLGAALLLSGTALLVASSWEDWTRPVRALVLGGVAAAALAGSLVAGRVGGWRRTAGEEAAPGLPGYRLRLSGALGAAAAFAAASAVLAGQEADGPAGAFLVSNLVGLAVALAAYASCRSALAQVALVGYGVAVTGESLARLDAPDAAFVGSLVGYGVLWLLLARLGLLREVDLAVAAGGVVVLGGLQYGFATESDGGTVLAYVLGLAVAAGAVAAYPRWRRWPLLVLAVLAVTLAASQLAADLFGSGTRGAAVALLVAGGVLTAGSVVAVRWHRASRG